MTDLRQNFSLIAGDDVGVDYGIVPHPPVPIDLMQADMTWTAYPQVRGVADKTTPVIVKTKAEGSIEILDPANYTFKVDIDSADTMELSGNYYYDIVIIDPLNDNRRSTPTIGTMTVIDTGEPINVVAFKSMFPQFESVDDSVVQTALDEAALFVGDDWAASDAQAATFYLAAHFLTVAQASSSSGGDGRLITSESIGQISVSYAAAASSSSSTSYPSLSNSSYGLMFLAVMRRNSAGIEVV
jgi:hypothetical protein